MSAFPSHATCLTDSVSWPRTLTKAWVVDHLFLGIVLQPLNYAHFCWERSPQVPAVTHCLYLLPVLNHPGLDRKSPGCRNKVMKWLGLESVRDGWTLTLKTEKWLRTGILDSSGELCRRGCMKAGRTLPCLLLPFRCILFCSICVCGWPRELMHHCAKKETCFCGLG